LGTVFTITPAGSFAVLHSFTGGNDGANPRGALQQGTNGNFYGTTEFGGSNYNGTIFMITPQGILTPLHSLQSQVDGANPLAGLVLATDGAFYGTTFLGGAQGYGTVFRMTSTGAFSNIYSFGGAVDGGSCLAPLIQGADGELYGTASGGGNTLLNEGYGYGAIFKITTGGSLTPLYAFTNSSDGETPYSGLVQGMDGSFYGTAIHGTAGAGCIYQVTAQGGFNVLHDFGGEDGSGPTGTLIQAADANLYGTTMGGGANGAGTVFQITTNGAFTSLISFANTSTELVPSAGPLAGVLQGANGDLYGVTKGGGIGPGTIFTATTAGDFTNLYSFPAGGGDGAHPSEALFADPNGLLYGTAWGGGTNGVGTVFQVTTNGTLSTMYTFTNGIDGTTPLATLVADINGDLWGTTSGGSSLTNGGAPYGTVFKITTNGILTTIYTFTNGTDGSAPRAGLVQGFDGNFYGTCTSPNGAIYVPQSGSVFRITPAGVFSDLDSFSGTSVAALLEGTDTNFYGTTMQGGEGSGTLFEVTPEGAFSVIQSLSPSDGPSYGALIQGADGNLYGTSDGIGAFGFGTIFKLTLPSTLSNIYLFTNGIDGDAPMAGLFQASDGNFYGTTSAGGLYGDGTIFRITRAGSFQPLYSFSAVDDFGLNQDGANPVASLIQGADGCLYGLAEYGGHFGTGTIFKLTITPPAPPQILSATESGGILNFVWSAEPGAQYQLQYSTNLAQSNWINLGASMAATAQTLSESDFYPTDAQRFYRVLALP